jgi:hypothetical protein
MEVGKMDLRRFVGKSIVSADLSTPFFGNEVLTIKFVDREQLRFQPTKSGKLAFGIRIGDTDLYPIVVLEYDKQVFVSYNHREMPPNISPLIQFMRVLDISPTTIDEPNLPTSITIDGDIDFGRLGKYLDFGNGKTFGGLTALTITIISSTSHMVGRVPTAFGGGNAFQDSAQLRAF